VTRSVAKTEWHPASWQSLAAAQQPSYPDKAALERAIANLSRLPPIVTSWEIEGLKEKIARAQRGEAFVLQGGDCAESFDECTSENIVAKLKILLQMSLVMLYGLKKPVVRVGRMAGQYAKPRSADTETRDGSSLPSFRGDLVNRNPFTAEDRIPDPELILRGYERAALTLNFVRSLIDGGFVGSRLGGSFQDGRRVPRNRAFHLKLAGFPRVDNRAGDTPGTTCLYLCRSRRAAFVL
jgi:3-deoxy-7-phosphoheptulonate synthase